MFRTVSILLLLTLAMNGVFGQNTSGTLPDLIPYRKGQLWGYCDSNKHIIINPQFSYARPFVNDLAEVSIDSTLEAVINKKGEIIISVFRDTTVWVSDSGRVYTELNNQKIKLREFNGDWFIPQKYKLYLGFSPGSYIMRKGKNYGVVDRYEKIIIPFKYFSISQPDAAGFVKLTKKNGHNLFVDISGQRKLLKISKKYSASHFAEDFASYSLIKGKNNLIGFIDRTGQIKIPINYKSASIFINGLCEVSNGIKTGFINKNGDTVISFKYGSARNLNNGYVSYSEILYSTLYDVNDKEILRCQANSIEYINDSLIIISKKGNGPFSNSKYGIIDINGKEIWPCIYYAIYCNLYPGLIYVLENWKEEPYYVDYKFNKYYEDQ